jgi:hypothetical protein
MPIMIVISIIVMTIIDLAVHVKAFGDGRRVQTRRLRSRPF